MKITICGSMAFYKEMLENKSKLEKLSHSVKIPPKSILDENGNPMPVEKYYALRQNASEEETWIWKRKKEAILKHFDKINWSDVILVLNYDKNNISNYVGGNTFGEMSIALYLKKGIYLLNPLPVGVNYWEEMVGMQPIIINGDLELIK